MTGNLSVSVAILDINLRGPTATFDELGLAAVRSAWEDVKRHLSREAQLVSQDGQGPIRASSAQDEPPSSPTREATADGEPNPDRVHRTCRIVNGECEGCPPIVFIEGDECRRGCYAQAIEVINTVETGNPWRKLDPALWAVTPSSGEPLIGSAGEAEVSLQAPDEPK